MARPVFVFVVAVAMAGCATPMNAPGSAATPALPVGVLPAWPMPGIPLGTEPALVTGPDGSVYAALMASGSGSTVNVVLRSVDGGVTWTDPTPVAAPYGTQDVTISVGPDGRVWVGTLQAQAVPDSTLVVAPVCVIASLSTDAGRSFHDNPTACGAPVMWDRPWIAAGPTFAYLYQWNPAQSGQVIGSLARTTDNVAWTAAPFTGSSHYAPLEGPIAATAKGVEVPFFEPDASNEAYRGPWVATAPDPGVAWSRTKIADDPSGTMFPVMARDGDDAAVAWLTPRGGDRKGPMDVRLAVQTAGQWSAAVTLQSQGSSVFVWTAVRHGHVAVAWIHSDTPAHSNAMPAEAEWQAQVWVDGTLRDIGFIAHRGPLCAAVLSAVSCPPGSRTLRDLVGLTLLDDGTAIVAFPADTAPSLPKDRAVPMLAIAKPARAT